MDRDLLEAELDGLGGYVTPARAAHLLGVSLAAVYKRMHRQHMPVVRVGRQLFLRWQDIRTPGARPAGM